MKKILKTMVVGLMIISASSMFVFAQGSTEAKKMTLKLGFSSPESNPWYICAEQMAEEVYEKTDGNITIELFPSEILGSDKQMAEMVKMNTLDMQIAPQGVVANYEPKLAALELPFLFDSNEAVAKLLDGPMGEELAKDLPSKGIRILAYWENGLRQTTNNVRPITTPSDFEGMKIRTPDNKMTISIFEALGANPAPLAYSELYMALSQGVFDGQENPVVNIHASKLNEVQEYISFTNHKYEGKPFIISEETWKKLSPEYQTILSDAAKKYAVINRQMFADQDKELRADLEAKGMKLNSPDLAPFREATASVYDEWKATLGEDLINRVVKAAQGN
ncbi:MAG: TRAP transporter substrate-binding protein [Pleomorphochaeta sp.]